MAVIQRAVEINYTPQQMFDLVNDIATYPEFISWCSDAVILAKSERNMKASITVQALGYCKTFTTHNELERPNEMVMHLIDGPFKYLKGSWQFKSLDITSTRVTLKIDFELAESIVSHAIMPILDKMATQLVSTFSKQAKVIYGNS